MTTGTERRATVTKPASAAAVMAVMIVAAAMDMIDITIVNVALPTIGTSLQAAPEHLEWVMAGYLLAFGATLVFFGHLGDRVGRKKVFVSALVAFTLASLAAGLALNARALVVARVAQGLAAGAVIPQVLATFRASFDHDVRAKAFAVYGAVTGLAAAAGVVLGGVLTGISLFGLGWRAVFLVNVPVGVLAAVVAARVVPESAAPGDDHRLDWPGAVVLSAALTCLSFPLIEGPRRGWPLWGWGVVLLGVVLLVYLLARPAARDAAADPVLPLALVCVRPLAIGALVAALFSVGLHGVSLALTVWLQFGHGYSPLRTGLTLLVFSLGTIVVAPIAPRLAARHGGRALAVGCVLLAAGALLGAVAPWRSSPPTWWLLTGLLVMGIGLGLLVIPLVNVALSAAPTHLAGGASGLFSTAQQIGGTLGIAALGTLFFSRMAATGGTGHLDAAYTATAPWAAVLWLAAGLLCLALPPTALGEEALAELG